jgi:hypothetical protein
VATASPVRKGAAKREGERERKVAAASEKEKREAAEGGGRRG